MQEQCISHHIDINAQPTLEFGFFTVGNDQNGKEWISNSCTPQCDRYAQDLVTLVGDETEVRLHANVWKNRSANCAIEMWNHSSLCADVPFLMKEGGDTTISSNNVLVHVARKLDMKTNNAWDCSC